MAVGTGLLVAEGPEQQIPGVCSDTKFFIGKSHVQSCFISSTVLHSFYWPDQGNYGIPESRQISFNAADLLSFQLAGYLENHPSKPLYYIKRKTDHKQLSLTLGGPAYTQSQSSIYQQWMVCELGENKYCLMLAAVPGRFFLRPFTQDSDFFLSVIPAKEVKHVSSVAVYMKEL